MGRLGLLIVLLANLMAAGVRAAEGEWTRFRGPDGGGISTAATVPVKWIEKDCNWRVKVPGVGHSSPVAWGDKIFLTSGDPETAKRMVLCLAAADGRILWQRDYPSKTYEQNDDNSYASATPAVDSGGVYVTWTVPKEVTLLALDHAGNQKWRRDLGPHVAEHGSGTSPIAHEGLVVLASDHDGKSFIVAADSKTGETRWQVPRRSGMASYATPCVARPAGGLPELVFASGINGLTAVDPASGKVNWELDEFGNNRCVGSPVFAEGLVLVSYGYGEPGCRFVAVRPPSKQKGAKAEVAYEYTKTVPLVVTPLAKDGRVFLWADDGHVTCLSAAGGKVVWREKVGGKFFGSPVWVAGRLYCISKNGEVFVLAAADKFELLARIPLGEPSFATPAIAGGVMYLRTASHLMSLGGKKM
jgi:outer membrane protein assembly factor BamB